MEVHTPRNPNVDTRSSENMAYCNSVTPFQVKKIETCACALPSSFKSSRSLCGATVIVMFTLQTTPPYTHNKHRHTYGETIKKNRDKKVAFGFALFVEPIRGCSASLSYHLRLIGGSAACTWNMDRLTQPTRLWQLTSHRASCHPAVNSRLTPCSGSALTGLLNTCASDSNDPRCSPRSTEMVRSIQPRIPPHIASPLFAGSHTHARAHTHTHPCLSLGIRLHGKGHVQRAYG
jgi:hypothetical protein